MLDGHKSSAGRFGIEDKRIYDIIQLMCADDILTKAIHYTREDSLDQPSLPDGTILNRVNILEDNVVPDIQTETNTIINVYFDRIILDHSNILLDNGILRFDIFINKANRYLSNGTRLSVIKDRINTLFGFSRDIIGKGIAKRIDARYLSPNMFYIGYSLSYKSIESS